MALQKLPGVGSEFSLGKDGALMMEDPIRGEMDPGNETGGSVRVLLLYAA
jgi:hypothetical protein